MDSEHREHLRRCIEAVRSQVGVSTYPLAASVAQGDEVLSLEVSTLPASVDPSGHPEMCAIRAAAARVGSRYLAGAVLYSTVEPCPMCASAAIWAKMSGIVFGVSQDDVGEFARAHATPALSWRQIRIPVETVVAAGSPHLWVKGGVLREECLSLLDLTASRSSQDGVPGA
jgi:tRNA(Arg) A34 adenosine deaminase TadA